MTEAPAPAAGRRHDILSRVSRRAAQLVRTRTLRPPTPVPLISFTFDDIPDTAAEAGAAMLDRHGARGTFYVAAGLLGTCHDGVAFASAAAVGDLAARGHEIGCHTFSHPDVQRLPPTAVAAELDRNAAAIHDVAPSVRLTNFAYPYGSFALPQKRTVQQRFRSARGTREGINRGSLDLGHLLAVRLYDHLLGPERLDALVREAVATRGWLIFYTHDVAPTPSAHGSSPTLLAAALEAAHRHGCPVATVDAALDRLAA